jgi:hypothetical protein
MTLVLLAAVGSIVVTALLTLALYRMNTTEGGSRRGGEEGGDAGGGD